MQTASRELCEELYKLTGWNDTDLWHGDDPEADLEVGFPAMADPQEHEVYAAYPAYTVGYLLRKLQGDCEIGVIALRTGFYLAKSGYEYSFKRATAETPEDALCKLAITLANQGLLPKGGE